MKLCNAQRKRRAEEVHSLKFSGAMIVIMASLGVGYFLGESIRRRIRDIDALADFADFVSSEIAVYKTPLPEIFAKCDDRYLAETGFTGGLGGGVYTAAADSGMLAGDEERQIIRDFSAKIGSGGAEDMVKLCVGARRCFGRVNADLAGVERIGYGGRTYSEGRGGGISRNCRVSGTLKSGQG